jgi:hypothetical protein
LGWFDRIFGKGEDRGDKEEKFEETKMSLKEVENFLADRMRRDFVPLKETAKREHANMQAAAIIMKEQLKALAQAIYSEKTFPMLIRKAVGSRKSFVHKMDILVRQIQKPIGDDMQSILDFHNETAKLIITTNEKTVREYAFMEELFEKEAKGVLQSFSKIAEIDKKLGSAIGEFKQSNEQLLKAQQAVAEVSQLTEELKRRNGANSSESDKMLKGIEDKIKKAEEDLKKLFDSNEWKAFLDMKKSVEGMKVVLQDKRSDFVQAAAKVEAPLKKYNWSAKKKVLDDYARHSLESVLAEDPRGETLMSALKSIKTKITEGEMELKDSGKFLTTIESMIQQNTMGNILKEYSNLSEELRDQVSKIESHDVPKKKSNLEGEIRGLKTEIQDIKTEAKDAEERRERMQTDKEQKLKELKNLLDDVTGKSILLEVN